MRKCHIVHEDVDKVQFCKLLDGELIKRTKILPSSKAGQAGHPRDKRGQGSRRHSGPVDVQVLELDKIT